MMEIKTEVKCYIVKLMCDVCNIGEMKSNGMGYPCSPMKYGYECENCKHTDIVIGSYPKVEYSE